MKDLKRSNFSENDWFDDDDEDSQKDQYLTFRIQNSVYGIPIRNVTEIISMQEITEIPEMMKFVKGIINLRGNVIPVIDVRIRFQMEEREFDEYTCIVIVNISELSVGLIVDTVNEVVTIPAEDISQAPQLQKGGSSRFINRMGRAGKGVIILVDLEKFLKDEEMSALSTIAENG
ncbi:MAG: purine-binding chemotaxis protein CheW [Candidatus Riflebacteria bacterium]|nr:purine-binding chemotaxis protein CheW [Candidatus Riflebacteria bacterium]